MFKCADCENGGERKANGSDGDKDTVTGFLLGGIGCLASTANQISW